MVITDLQQIIHNNDDWETTLCKHPYSLRIKQHKTFLSLYIFSYNLIESDSHINVCSGIEHTKSIPELIQDYGNPRVL
jgi:hypothetical protein